MLAEGIHATLERGVGEPDFTLYDDGYAEVRMTVGYDGDELYFTAGAALTPRGTSSAAPRAASPSTATDSARSRPRRLTSSRNGAPSAAYGDGERLR